MSHFSIGMIEIHKRKSFKKIIQNGRRRWGPKIEKISGIGYSKNILCNDS